MFLLAAARLAWAGMSEPVLVDSAPQLAHWGTVFTNAVELAWEWPEGAASAELAAEGMTAAFTRTFAPGVSSWRWEVPAPEDVYTLTLAFRDGGGGGVGTPLTARLAVVSGARGGGTPVNAVDGSPAWPRIKTDAVILPYDAAWLAADGAGTLAVVKTGGASQTDALPDAAGWHGWNLDGWGYGTFNLSLAFPGAAEGLEAVLSRFQAGTTVVVR
jgi:hypothetical protein